MRLLFGNIFSNISEILKTTVMKKFKMIDCWVSAILIVIFTVLSIPASIKTGWMLNNTVLTGYFVVGGWQVISMIVHSIKQSFTRKGSSRLIYHVITIVSIVTIPAGSFYILFLTAPFMAIYYTFLCFDETYNKMKRPLALLK